MEARIPHEGVGKAGSFQRLWQASPLVLVAVAVLGLCPHHPNLCLSSLSLLLSLTRTPSLDLGPSLYPRMMSRFLTTSICKGYISREVTFTGSECQDTDMSSEGPYSAAPADKQAPDHRRQGQDAALHRTGGGGHSRRFHPRPQWPTREAGNHQGQDHILV